MVMANSQDNFGILDQNIPLWKRELILRRRAISRTLGASSNSNSNSAVKPACPSQTAVRQPDPSEAAVEKPQRSISAGLASNKDPLDQDEADFHPRGRGRFQPDSSSPSTAPWAAVSSNMRLVEVDESDSGLLVNGVGGGVDTNGSILTCSVKYRSRMVEERSPKKSSVSSRTIMDNSLVSLAKARAAKNNNCDHADNEECNSDSSEELQYGPGIVNRLKSKYLSLALRETQNRPSLSNIRRYSSLENILDNDLETGKPQITNQLATYTKKADACANAEQRFRTSSRGSRKDSMKRARSVETLHRYDSRFNYSRNEGLGLTAGFPSYAKPSPQDVNKNRPTSMINPLVNEELVIIENKMKMEPKKTEGKLHSKEKAPVAPQRTRIPQTLPVEKGLPPPDAVKQKLKIFENSQKPPRAVKTSVIVNKVQSSTNINSVSTSIIPKTNFSHNSFPKPALSPKPNIVLEKPQSPVVISPASPRKVIMTEECRSGILSPAVVPRPNLLHVESASTPTSPDSSPASVRKPKSTSPVPTIRSPHTLSPVGHALPSMPSASLHSRLTNGEALVGHVHDLPAEGSSSEDEDTGKVIKKVSKSALENIRKDGASISFSFSSASNTSEKPKSYLPNARTAPIKSQAPSPVQISKPAEPSLPKQVGVIRPILTSKPQPQSPQTQLTSQEAEKNLINRVKSIEQPSKKVAAPVPKPRSELPVAGETIHASVGASSEVSSAAKAPGLWDRKKPWNQQQNTMVFNFSGTKSPVPDYIENDGVILRSKRQKPKAGESGIILLGASADESSDFDTEEERLVQAGPPSPCNVVFEGADVLINGRSSMARQPRQRKLQITFSEVLTSTFEYPSEACLLEDQPAPVASPTTSLAPSGPTSGVPSPLGGSSLASYTPSKVHLGSEDFQLGITRAAPPASASLQPTPAPSLLHDEVTEEDTYLKPAQDGDTVAWSAETAADLLF